MNEQFKEKYLAVVNETFASIPYIKISDSTCGFDMTQLLTSPKSFVDSIQLLISDEQFLQLNTFDIYGVLTNLIELYYNTPLHTQGVVLSLMCKTLQTSHYFLSNVPNNWDILPEDVTNQIQNVINTK